MHRKSFLKPATFLLILGIIASLFPASTVRAAEGRVKFQPVADAFISSEQPNDNFGSRAALRIDTAPERRAYLRFDVSGLGAPIVGAKLRLWSETGSERGVSIKAVDDDGWDEKAITWNNAPQTGSLVKESGKINASDWFVVDVSSYVTAEGLISFAITTDGATAIRLAAREAGNSPQLVVLTGSPTQPTPTTTTPAPTTPAPTATPPGPTPTSTATPPPTSTPPPPPSGDAVLVGAGDISICGSNGDDQTAALLANIPGTIFTAGDNSNDDGTTAQFNNCFDPAWGQYKSRIRPAPGNHDYHTTGASGYFSYYGSAAGTAGKGYYSYNLGAWHVIALNSNCDEVGGCGAGSAMERWLRADLAASSAQCTVAYWHHPRFSSGASHGNNTEVQPLWQALYDYGAEIVLNGHDHDYERFAPQTPTGALNTLRGIREFVLGTGGAGSRGFGTIKANSEVRNGSTLGVLKLTLHADSYDWKFIPVAGKTFTDSGSDVCH